MGFSRQEYWRGLPLPSPGDLPDPGNKPQVSCTVVRCVDWSHLKFMATTGKLRLGQASPAWSQSRGFSKCGPRCMSPTWELVRKADPGSAESILTLTSPPGDSHAPEPHLHCSHSPWAPRETFFVKSHIANILGFAGHRVSITTIPNSAAVERKRPQTVHKLI